METPDLNVFHISNIIQELTSEGICIVSPDQKIEFCNPAMTRIFGFATTENMVSLPFNQLYADHKQFIFLVNKLKQTGNLISERVLLVRKDGCIFWGRIDCKPITHDGKTFFFITLKDISERIKKEEFLREQTLALEKANTELNRFIYSASHDLRAPISTIKGLVNLMKIENTQNHQLIQLIETSLGKLDSFIHKLTYFSRNKAKITRSTKINFKRIASQIKERMGNHPYFLQIEWKNQFKLSTSPFYSSRFRIEFILEEIIRNAYDFHDLTKPSPYILLAVNSGYEGIEIVIEDNGAGIPSAFVNHVFNMFYRASTVSHGSGVGLFVVHEAVKKLGGTISLESELGIGTKVIIKLPTQKKYEQGVILYTD